MGSFRLSEDEIANIRRARMAGSTHAEIAKLVKRSKSAVIDACAGIKARAWQKQSAKVALAQKALEQANGAPQVLSEKSRKAIEKLRTALKRDGVSLLALDVTKGQFKATYVREEAGTCG